MISTIQSEFLRESVFKVGLPCGKAEVEWNGDALFFVAEQNRGYPVHVSSDADWQDGLSVESLGLSFKLWPIVAHTHFTAVEIDFNFLRTATLQSDLQAQWP